MSEDTRDTPREESDGPEAKDQPNEAEEPLNEDETPSEEEVVEDPVSTDPSDPSEVPDEQAEAPEAMSAEAELALLTAELAATRRERDEYLDGLRRLKAEFDNSRKRMDRERERIFQTASERIVSELLPVLDNLERALEAEGDVREGVRVTRDQLADVLEREGLVAIDSDGEAFDPSVHEAVMGQPSDEHEEGTILQTFERGYVLNGRAIRPAKVVVARQG